MRRRVKITGIGPVTPAGIGRDAFFAGINEPISRVGEVTGFSERGGLKFIAAQVGPFNFLDWVDWLDRPNRLPRQTQFGLIGTKLALDDAGWTIAALRDSNPVIVNGSSLIDPDLVSRTILGVAADGPRAAKLGIVFDAPPISVAGAISQMLGLPNSRIIALQSACCAGLDGLGHGYEMVATGQADLAICCGTEAPIVYNPMVEFAAARLSPQNAAAPQEMGRPFDLWRTTGVIGEGAAVCILEPETSPRRGYAWISGYAYANDTLESEVASGLGLTMRMALANAGRHPEDVEYVSAWGPGHPTVDRGEARALLNFLGSRAREVPVSSIKGAIGNPLAAAGSIQVASTALALHHRMIPPTVNWRVRDPDCPLNLSGRSRRLEARVALVNAHGLSGSNATMVLEVCR